MGEIKTNIFNQSSIYSHLEVKQMYVHACIHIYIHVKNKYKYTDLFENEVSSALSCTSNEIQVVIFKATTMLGIETWNEVKLKWHIVLYSCQDEDTFLEWFFPVCCKLSDTFKSSKKVYSHISPSYFTDFYREANFGVF